MRYGKGSMAVAVLLACFGMPAWADEDNVTRVEPVQVTATRIPRKVSEQASSVSVVTREDIELQSPPLASDLVRNQPGVDVLRSGSPGGIENIKIRGGRAAHTLVLIDGFQVNSPMRGEFDLGALPADIFDRAEVVRGAQSALYGSSAISGVVNFIPRKGADADRGGAGLSGGSHNSLQWNAFGRAGEGERNLIVQGNGFRGDGIMANDGIEMTSFLAAGELPVGERNRLHAIFLSTDEQKQVPISLFVPRNTNQLDVRRSNLVGARWETDLSKMLTVIASGSYQDDYFNIDNPPAPGKFAFTSLTKSRRNTADLQARFSPNRYSTSILGGEYVRDHGFNELRSVPPSPFDFPAVSEGLLTRSLYFQQEFRPTDHSGISLGGRFERAGDQPAKFNPKAGAYCELPGGTIRLRTAAGRGYRVPAILEKFDAFLGNPQLKPESAWSYEAGADAAFASKRAKLSATWFYEDFRDMIDFPAPTFVGANVPRAFSRGVEGSADLALVRSVRLILAYMYTESWVPQFQSAVTAVPKQRGTVSMVANPLSGLETRADWHVESDMLDSPPNGETRRRPGFARVDLFTKYGWSPAGSGVRDVALTGEIRNVLNRDYEERRGYPAPGITFMVGTQIRI